MKIKEKITLDNLTNESVSVLRQQYLCYNGVEMQIGDNVRNSYTDCDEDRKILKEQLSDEYFNAVLAVWGN